MSQVITIAIAKMALVPLFALCDCDVAIALAMAIAVCERALNHGSNMDWKMGKWDIFQLENDTVRSRLSSFLVIE